MLPALANLSNHHLLYFLYLKDFWEEFADYLKLHGDNFFWSRLNDALGPSSFAGA